MDGVPARYDYTSVGSWADGTHCDSVRYPIQGQAVGIKRSEGKKRADEKEAAGIRRVYKERFKTSGCGYKEWFRTSG